MIEEKALHIIKELMHSDLMGNECSFPKITHGFDISDFYEQPSDLDGVDTEFIYQAGDGEMCPYHGQMAYKLSDDSYLVVGFHE